MARKSYNVAARPDYFSPVMTMASRKKRGQEKFRTTNKDLLIIPGQGVKRAEDGRCLSPPGEAVQDKRSRGGTVTGLYRVAFKQVLFKTVILNGAKRSEESRFFASLRMTILLF